MSSRLVYVVGPSGVGKDSLLAWLSAQLDQHTLPPVHIARRSITRAADLGTEGHEALATEAFAALASDGAFAMHWQANGLQYGIRQTELAGLEAGGWVLVNGSRAYVPTLRQNWPGVCVLHIDAPAAVVRERLLRRGREAAQDIEARVTRSQQLSAPSMPGDLQISNAGSLEDCGHQLLALLRHRMQTHAP